MNQKKLAKKLKELRVIRGMSQEFLAEESRVGLRTIQRIENEESEPTGETIKRLASGLGVEIKELIGSNITNETSDLKGAIIFLKRQLSKANKKSEIQTFNRFINVLTNLKNKELNKSQLEAVESYLLYLELEKIPSYSNDLFKQKLSMFRKYLKSKLSFVPNNYYAIHFFYFAFPFAIGFAVAANNIDIIIKIGVAFASIILIAIGAILDLRIKKRGQSLGF